ncbi:hypothetical protein [Novosphingobium panipatense]|uniref:hypothetical protein n=1 Tax=Novosphingobium panipatense TaxID=428991 RepID=UPI0036235D6C
MLIHACPTPTLDQTRICASVLRRNAGHTAPGACKRPSGQLSGASFDLPEIDGQLADAGLDSSGLHEVAAATASLNDDAAATLFLAGVAGRFATHPNSTMLWAVTAFDLYAPGLEQVGLNPGKSFTARGARTPKFSPWRKMPCETVRWPVSWRK